MAANSYYNSLYISFGITWENSDLIIVYEDVNNVFAKINFFVQNIFHSTGFIDLSKKDGRLAPVFHLLLRR